MDSQGLPSPLQIRISIHFEELERDLLASIRGNIHQALMFPTEK